jgi:hypothetical protein
MVKNSEGSGRDLFKALSQYLPGGSKENLSRGSRSPGRGLNP